MNEPKVERVGCMLTVQQHARLKQYARLRGIPMSSVIESMIDIALRNPDMWVPGVNRGVAQYDPYAEYNVRESTYTVKK